MTITGDMKVADVFELYPQTQRVFQEYGFGALANPALRKTFGRLTSVERGCLFHGVDLTKFLTALNKSLSADPNPAPSSSETCQIVNPEIQQILKMKTDELVKNHPGTREVFIKYFGPGCFSCPAFGQEDTAFACTMHNTDPVEFAQECLQKC